MHRPNRARCVNGSRSDGDNKNSSPGRARHTPSAHRAGKAECSASPVCCCAVSLRYTFAQRTAGACRHPVFPAPSSRRRAKAKSETRGFPAARTLIHVHFWKMEWCCQTGLNCRPLHYQWSALPLSYGSMCWDKNRPPEGPTKRADICHRPPHCASLQGRPKRENRDDIGGNTAVMVRKNRLSADFGSSSPRQLASWPVTPIPAILSFARSGPRGPLELPHSLGMLSPTAVWTRHG